jgi:ubiquinone/menaquinone biosynthesis C-methylase UbiE
MVETAEQLAAELYDLSVPDWEGEIDFYRGFAYKVRDRGQSVLEIACGTGRVSLRLAREGVNIVGVDLDEEMLRVARQKSEGLPNIRWVRGDMRSLDLGESFDLIILPGHSFQFMCTPQDQVTALQVFNRHLAPDGFLIVHLDHQDVDWLGDLVRDLGGKFGPPTEVTHPQTGHTLRKSNAWVYERSTQTATVTSRWEEVEKDGFIAHRWERPPMALHCIFPFEMEHLLARAGFTNRAVYGDFFKSPLNDKSPEMIWIARKA